LYNFHRILDWHPVQFGINLYRTETLKFTMRYSIFVSTGQTEKN